MRSRPVADEEDHVLATLEKLGECVGRTTGSVHQHRVGTGQAGDIVQLARPANGRDRQELDGKISLGFQLVQFFANPCHLGFRRFLRVDVAPGPPTGLRTRRVDAVLQDRLDLQSPARRRRPQFDRIIRAGQ